MLVTITVAVQVRGTTITDVGYFTSRPHTLISFEQRGNGSPTANATLLPPNEYQVGRDVLARSVARRRMDVTTPPIRAIHVKGVIALLDNFRFIALPEPSGLNCCWGGGLAIGLLALRRH
jgi:hypothetical protein